MNKTILAIIIIVTSLIVGLMNTVLIRSEEVGSWRNYVGYLFLIIAVINFYFLIRKNFIERKRGDLQKKVELIPSIF